MACCTLSPTQKRTLEFDLPKSKRRKCGTMYTIQQQQSNSTNLQPIIIDTKAKSSNSLLLNTQHDDNNKNTQIVQHIYNEAKKLMKRKQLQQPSSQSNEFNFQFKQPQLTTSKHFSLQNKCIKSNETPLFTISQVNQICNKMLEEREECLREHYETILNQKLNEQYDAFVKFTHEQIQKQFEKTQFSYVS